MELRFEIEFCFVDLMELGPGWWMIFCCSLCQTPQENISWEKTDLETQVVLLARICFQKQNGETQKKMIVKNHRLQRCPILRPNVSNGLNSFFNTNHLLNLLNHMPQILVI